MTTKTSNNKRKAAEVAVKHAGGVATRMKGDKMFQLGARAVLRGKSK